jgi:hypothetical protein
VKVCTALLHYVGLRLRMRQGEASVVGESNTVGGGGVETLLLCMSNWGTRSVFG